MVVSIAEMISLEGRVAVVTGGARGIGHAISRRLAEAGATLVVADIDAAARECAAAMGGTGVMADVTDPASHQRVADEASNLGALSIWVNNAGVLPLDSSNDVDIDEWDRMLDLDLRSVYFGAVAAAQRMRTRGGVILNVSSTTGLRGYPGMPHYVAAKHGVVGLTRALAADFAPAIRVLGIAPTLVMTEGMAAKRRAIIAGGGVDPVAAAEARIPMRRVAEPDDVARVALFCVSDLAGYLTGQTIPVDGGRLAVEM